MPTRPHAAGVILLLSFLFLLPASLSAKSLPPQAKDGVLDLSSWDFWIEGPVNLEGKWDMYWNELLEPRDFQFGWKTLPVPEKVQVPGYWTSTTDHPADGFCTYRLRIHLYDYNGQDIPMLGLRFTEILTSFRVWVNGREVFHNGIVGKNSSHSSPEYRPGIVHIQLGQPEIDLVVQIADFSYRKSGMWSPITLGLSQDIESAWYSSSHLSLFLLGSLAMMGMYHVALFFLRRSDKSSIWFAFFCFIIFSRAVSTGDHLLSQWIPGFNWEIGRKMEFLPLSLGPLVFSLFIRELYSRYFNPALMMVNKIIGTVFSVLILALPAVLTNNLILYMEIYVFLVVAWVLWVLVLAFRDRQPGSVQMLLGVSILSATIVNDLFYANQVVGTAYLIPFGFFIFIFFQASILAMKSIGNQNKAENMAVQLESANKSFRRFVPYQVLQLLGRTQVSDIQLGDHSQRELTVMFADIRSFTSLSETMSPKETFDFLNSYLKRMGPLIRQHKGIIDKFMGDGILAIFPECLEDAVNAGIAMQKELVVYNQHRYAYGYRELEIGISVHRDLMILGTIGEHDRVDSTVIADGVNLASRLEGLSKIYGPGIIVTAEVFASLDKNAYSWRHLDLVRIRGKADKFQLIQIYSGLPDDMRAQLDACHDFWEEGMAAYAAGELQRAQRLLAQVSMDVPWDPSAAMMVRRIAVFEETGIPVPWDPVKDWT